MDLRGDHGGSTAVPRHRNHSIFSGTGPVFLAGTGNEVMAAREQFGIATAQWHSSNNQRGAGAFGGLQESRTISCVASSVGVGTLGRPSRWSINIRAPIMPTARAGGRTTF